jgi:hypothetical protein
MWLKEAATAESGVCGTMLPDCICLHTTVPIGKLTIVAPFVESACMHFPAAVRPFARKQNYQSYILLLLPGLGRCLMCMGIPVYVLPGTSSSLSADITSVISLGDPRRPSLGLYRHTREGIGKGWIS